MTAAQRLTNEQETLLYHIALLPTTEADGRLVRESGLVAHLQRSP